MKIKEYKVPQNGINNLNIFIAGDTFIGNAAKDIIETEGYEYPFLKLGRFYQTSDVRIINLEAPVCEIAKKTNLEKEYKYKMSPKALDVLKRLNFNILMLANNHTNDCGMDGLIETLDNLEQRNQIPIGAGKDLAEARQGILISKGNIKVGFLNYMAYKRYYDKTLKHYAKEHHAGVNQFKEETVEEDIINLKFNGAQTVIVSIHWGENYKPINDEQKRLAKLIIDSGADLIIGHGSHQYQPIQFINDKLVFYSIGNFVFNTKGKSPLTYGFPLNISFNENGFNKIEIYPILTNNRIVNYQPKYLKGMDAITALNELFANSKLGNGIKFKLSDHGIIYL